MTMVFEILSEIKTNSCICNSWNILSNAWINVSDWQNVILVKYDSKEMSFSLICLFLFLA